MAQQTKCRKKTEARREGILDAALEEFAAKGYAGARMEDIARRAGVAKGTLYLHFGDKEGLFNGLAESAFAPMHALAKAAGVYGMVGGQVIDLESEGRAIDIDLLRILQEGKTAALIAAACEVGCIIGGGGARQVAAAQRYGIHIGLCFQMIDDILDVTSTSEELGKPVGSDASNEKTTYVSLLGLDEVRRLAQEHTDAAVSALKTFKRDTADLRLLADRLLARSL